MITTCYQWFGLQSLELSFCHVQDIAGMSSSSPVIFCSGCDTAGRHNQLLTVFGIY